MLWNRGKSDKKYLHICQQKDEEGDKWEGKVQIIQKEISNNVQQIAQQVKHVQVSIENSGLNELQSTLKEFMKKQEIMEKRQEKIEKNVELLLMKGTQ